MALYRRRTGTPAAGRTGTPAPARIVTLAPGRTGTLVPGRIVTLAPRRTGVPAAASENRIDLAVEFLLDQPAAAGSRLEFRGEPQMLGTPYPEPADAVDADTGGTTEVLDVGKAFQGLGQPALRQAPQLRDGLVETVPAGACPVAVPRGA